MLRDVPASQALATLRETPEINSGNISAEEAATIIARADAMLRDENIFFTFPYKTRGIEQVWQFDPLEQKHWPIRHYTERNLHAADTPRDVKIVWEINRFKDLPALGQAAVLTRDKKYADEAELRLLSWIEDNPFAATINWASALEISIRLISWTATLLLLRKAGFDMHANPKIARSVYEQASYLAADLSTDKVVPTNHLIGEASDLFVVSVLWDFTKSKEFAEVARKILEEEIIRQTHADGATREASSWYHQFVTHFFDLVERVAPTPMSAPYSERLGKMKTYLSAMTFGGSVVRFGDADDGWAVFFEGDREAWKTRVFGASETSASFEHGLFPKAEHVAYHIDNSFLFIRGGEFGMGGAGYSSHAHDDFLSPIIFLDTFPVLADPGTFIYNGDRESRAKYRTAEAHNGLILNDATRPRQRMNFGWLKVRPDALIFGSQLRDDSAAAIGHYHEWPDHKRFVEIRPDVAFLIDTFEKQVTGTCEWRLHLDPIWSLEGILESGNYGFTNAAGDHLLIVLRGAFEARSLESYDFSPSYGVKQEGLVLSLATSNPVGHFEIVFSVQRNAVSASVE